MKNFVSDKFVKSPENIILVIALISVASIIFFHALNYGLNVEYRPYNGDFQTFNPLRRIFAGELPGRDFNPYLGLGSTYLNALVTYLFGGDFSASKFSTYLLSVTLHFLVLVNLFFFSGLRLNRAIIAAGLPLITIFLDVQKIVPIWEIIEPSNSNLSLRSFLPFLTTSLILLLFKFCRKYPYCFYSLSGCLIGIQPFWSNDYGIPSCLTLIAVIIFDLIKQKQGGKLLKFIWLLLSIFIAFTLGVFILTGGYPANWLKDNFGGVAVDQFWYFFWLNETNNNKIFALSDILLNPFFYCYFTATALLIIEILFKEYKIKSLLLIYVTLTAMGSGILSSVGGTISARYYLTSILISLFIFPLAIVFLVKLIQDLRNYTINGDNDARLSLLVPYISRFNGRRAWWLLSGVKINQPQGHRATTRDCPYIWTVKYLLILALAIYYPVVSIIGIINTQNFVLFPSENKGFFWVEELGGWLPKLWQKSIFIARKIEQELQSEPPTHRILSTYSSGMDVVAGSFNPTGVDYIIHALGDTARANYLHNFQETKPRYITTLREDFTQWETWIRRTNWWFYRDFFNYYQPIAATFYNIIWQRLEKPKISNNIPVYCQVISPSNYQVYLNIITEDKQNDRGIYYVEIALNYSLAVEPSGIPIIGKRGLVNARENRTALTRSIAKDYNRKYGMPPGHKNWYIPIEHHLGTTSILELESYPTNRSKLTVKSCQARVVAPVDDFTVTRQLKAANLSNSNWQNGINIIAQNNRTGFIIDDEQTLSELYPGVEVEFAKSGKRQIIGITDNQIWVSGSSLNPLADGYPNPIIIKLR